MILHHVGFIVDNIEKFKTQLIFEQEIKKIYDPIQDAEITLLSTMSNTFIELIQPVSDKSWTWNFLNKYANSFHHLCYQTSYERMETIVNEKDFIKIRGPVPAIIFDNHDVYFYYTKNRQIIEFLILED